MSSILSMTKIYAPIALFQDTTVNFVEANTFVEFKDAEDIIITYYNIKRGMDKS